MKKKTIISIISVLLSSLIIGATIKVFIQQFAFFSGGIGGVAIILSRVLSEFFENSRQAEGILFGLIYFPLNLPVLYLGYKHIGKRFALFSGVNVVLVSLFVAIIPYEILEWIGLSGFDDMVVISILVGLLFGYGTLIAFFSGFSLGGFDILGFYFNKRKGKNIGTYTFIFNIFVFVSAGIIFRDAIALIYTAIYMFILAVMINMLYTRDKRILLQIITTEYDVLAKKLREISGHSCTFVEVIGGYTREKNKQINIVITKIDYQPVIKLIKETDSNAFIVIQDVRATIGKFYVRPLD